ncbi:hypothetical protein ACIA8C_23925 [Nocardia sp. NPDC051321]|uniref:hypothetical protein n=1 Tax=Nocardia sp. NPDC051321 TaxID=3364323 RepID=UPI003797D69F
MLLKLFLLSRGRPMAMDELIELCFPATPRDKAARNFHVTMHSLRRMLEPDLGPRAESSFVRRTDANFYRFETGATWWTDTSEVERLFKRARADDKRGDTCRASFYYSRVSAYAVRRFLEDDPYNPWLQPYRRRYEGMYTEALTRLIRLHSACRELDETFEYCHQLLRLDPTNGLAATAMNDARRELSGSTDPQLRAGPGVASGDGQFLVSPWPGRAP